MEGNFVSFDLLKLVGACLEACFTGRGISEFFAFFRRGDPVWSPELRTQPELRKSYRPRPHLLVPVSIGGICCIDVRWN